MSISRRVLQTAAVSGLVVGLVVPAGVAFADSAPSPSDRQTSASAPQTQEQDYKLSNGAQAHVFTLPNGSYMAWITVKGQRVANLSSDSASSTVNGYRYVLNEANGFVGVVHPNGWHSEQDKPNPADTSRHQHQHQQHHENRQGTPQKHAVHGSGTTSSRDTGTGASAVVQGGSDTRLPQGGVKAGAEGVASHGSETPLMLAAGGGLALAGAGIAYLGVRRGRRGES
ncbi:hypothetical protein GTY65_00630 [Streptomyces sp. SID8379]|uniref:hypothetical protein n=1 Tax=unclassified Streptomyces TaxID=2593676 RepID=UPI00036D057C|nr:MULTISPECIES: hypothetical protein [unclassified Streptomyces]MYW62590.1 hypothetical protein [Streptomyces sp. SID8379]